MPNKKDIKLENRKPEKTDHEVLKVIDRILERSTQLQTGALYTLAEICGKEWWTEEVIDVVSAGHVISHMAHEKLLPLRPAGKRSDNHRQYFIDRNFQQEKVCQ